MTPNDKSDMERIHELRAALVAADIRALADAATPGPWQEHRGNVVSETAGRAMVRSFLDTPDADLAFIAASRTAVPALLDENAALREQLLITQEGHDAAIAVGEEVIADRDTALAGVRAERDTLRERLDDALSERDSWRDDCFRAAVVSADARHSWVLACEATAKAKDERDTALARAEAAELLFEESKLVITKWESLCAQVHAARDEARRERDALVRVINRWVPSQYLSEHERARIYLATKQGVPALLAALGEKP